MKYLFNTFSQAINEDLDYFKIVFIRFFGNITSQLNKAPDASVSSVLNYVFINNQNSNNDNNGENLFI